MVRFQARSGPRLGPIPTSDCDPQRTSDSDRFGLRFTKLGIGLLARFVGADALRCVAGAILGELRILWQRRDLNGNVHNHASNRRIMHTWFCANPPWKRWYDGIVETR
jgi:hypothetical protein